MVRWRVRPALVVVVACSLASCHGRPRTAPCVPGHQDTCTCDDGLRGVQTCGPDGMPGACTSCTNADAAVYAIIDAVPDAVPDAPVDGPPPLTDTGGACTDTAKCAGNDP